MKRKRNSFGATSSTSPKNQCNAYQPSYDRLAALLFFTFTSTNDYATSLMAAKEWQRTPAIVTIKPHHLLHIGLRFLERGYLMIAIDFSRSGIVGGQR